MSTRQSKKNTHARKPAATSKSKPKQDDYAKSFPKKVLNIIGWTIIGLIVLVVVVTKVENYFRTREINNQAAAASSKVLTARSSGEKISEQKLAQFEKLVREAGVTDQQIASSKVDVCYIAHMSNDFWPVTNYQNCYFRYVRGYTTAISKDELVQKLRAQPGFATLFIERDWSTSAIGCELYQNTYTNGRSNGKLSYRPTDMAIERFDCTVPDPKQGLNTIDGFEDADTLATKVYQAYDASKIDNTTNQLWYSFDEKYYSEDLGCDNSFYCGSPRPKPIQAP